MKTKEIRDMKPADLQKKLAELKEELFNLRFQSATEQLENPMRIKSIRQDIARVKTIIHKKNRNISKEA